MAKKLIGKFKLQLKAGQASMSPPVGPAFGQRGLNGMEFVKAFNSRTQKDAGMIIPAEVSFYSDKSFDFVTKTPPAAVLIIKETGIKKGSGEPNKIKVGNITKAQCEKIAEIKMPDLNTTILDNAVEMIKGTARSMGVVYKEA